VFRLPEEYSTPRHCTFIVQFEDFVRNTLILNDKNLVEAAGVEPASENARREENYVRIRLKIFGSGLRTGQNDRHLARLISAYGSGPKPLAHPAK